MVSELVRRSGGLWNAHKFGGTPGNPVDRDTLIAGVDKPDASNTGPFTVSSWTDVFASGGGTTITIGTAGTYYGRRYWGTVKVSVPGVIFRECWFAGPDPALVPGSTTIVGCIQCFGSNPQQFQVWDSMIDPLPWVTVQGRASLHPYVVGVHGGNMSLYRTEVTNISDGWNWIGPSADPAASTQSHLCQQNWFHKCFYANNTYPPNDGQPHCDGIQTNYGRNFNIIGNTIGGDRDIVGYNIWPGGSNTGDDFWNSGFQLKQEADGGGYTELGRIRDLTIEKNWIAGGTSSINHASVASAPNAFLENCVIRDNKFLTRESDWGIKMKGDGPDLPGYDNSEPNGSGYYILRSNVFASLYSNNTNEQTGLPVTITNGG